MRVADEEKRKEEEEKKTKEQEIVVSQRLKYEKERATLLRSFTKVHTLGTPIEPITPLKIIKTDIDITTKEVVVFENSSPNVGTYF
jgi:hypothetical protein